MEKFVHAQLVNYFEDNKIFSRSQFGFRKNNSTVSETFHIVSTLLENYNTNRISSCIFVDYSKAFDTIDHSVLAHKLSLYGCSKRIVDWHVDYFRNRQQRTSVNGMVSESLLLSCGVPQRSSLGPLLFVIYVNDVFMVMQDEPGVVYMYADDMVLVTSSQSLTDAIAANQRCLNRLSEWSILNRLSINTKKTKHMLIGPNRKIRDNRQVIRLHGAPIANVMSHRYLVVIIDSGLCFEKGLNDIVRQVNHRLFNFGKVRKFINRRAAITIYNSTILPILEYADYLVESSRASFGLKLQSLQNRGLRIVEYSHSLVNRFSVEDLHIKNNIKYLNVRRKHNLLLLMHMLARESTFLDNQPRTRQLQGNDKIKFSISRPKTERYVKSPLFRGVKVWDALPALIQKLPPRIMFKAAIKNII